MCKSRACVQLLAAVYMLQIFMDILLERCIGTYSSWVFTLVNYNEGVLNVSVM